MLYDEAEALSDTIAGEEAALELEETQNAELLTDFQASFEPLRKLWAAAQLYTESSRDWLQLPLAQVDINQISDVNNDCLANPWLPPLALVVYPDPSPHTKISLAVNSAILCLC